MSEGFGLPPTLRPLLPLLGLYQCPRLGPATIGMLASELGCQVSEIATQPSALLSTMGLTEHQIETIKAPAEQALHQILGHMLPDTVFLGCDDDAYPQMLAACTGAPLFLFAQGNLALLDQPSIAIVGARHASAQGTQQAKTLAAELAQVGLVITSGLAQGIDAAAHRGALMVSGATIAVLGHGLRYTYPKHHANLRAQIIAEGGLVLSEFLPNEAAKPYFFPRRNRVIAGLSHGVCLIEAGIQSGSMHSAQHALSCDREIFAMPGSVADARHRGCHQLIQQGAHLINDAHDVLDNLPLSVKAYIENRQLNPHITDNKENGTKKLPQHLANSPLLDSVGHEEISMDALIQTTHLPIHVLMSELTQLELAGAVLRTDTGYIKTKGY